jgi:hypothetical protein
VEQLPESHRKKLMTTIELIEYNGQEFSTVLAGDGGVFAYCKHCEQYETCDHSKPKILQVVQYVLGFIYDFNDYGLQAYPMQGGVDLQPDWFITLFRKGLNHLRKIRQEMQDERKTKI